MKKTFTITISRAHKIAERLGARQGEVRAEADSLAAQVTITGQTEGQVQRLQDQAGRAMALVDHCESLAIAQSLVRAAIGRANAQHGVNDTLAQIEANKKTLACIDPILKNQTESVRGSLVRLNELSSYKPLAQNDSLLGRGNVVQVSILSDEQMSHLKARKEALERRNFSLSDKLADLNGKLVTFELESELAEQLGLQA